VYWYCLAVETLAQDAEKASGGYRVTVLGLSNAAGTHRSNLMVIAKIIQTKVL
jgi:hypothetical protein